MDGLGAMMLGNEPALSKYMKEAPRRRDEGYYQQRYDDADRIYGDMAGYIKFLILKITSDHESI